MTDYTDPSTVDVDVVRGEINNAYAMRGGGWTDALAWPNVTVKAMSNRISELETALARLATDGLLKCVVDGQKTSDGQPAPLCPEIISFHQQMCAGCAASRFVRNAGGAA